MFNTRKSSMESRTSRRFEHALLIFGLLLSGIFVVAQVHRAILLNVEMTAFRKIREQQVLRRQPSIDFTAWSRSRISAYFNSLAEHVPPPLALLRIENVHLEVPVLDGTGESVLNRGVGHILGTGQPGEAGNVGIAGHRDGFFRVLEHVNLGDPIELETMHEIWRYRVNRIQIVDPTEITVLRPNGTPLLTLVTCYPFHFIGSAPKRYIVQASKVEVATASSAPQYGIPEENLASVHREASSFKLDNDRQRR
jgi:sortase A